MFVGSLEQFKGNAKIASPVRVIANLCVALPFQQVGTIDIKIGGEVAG